MKKILYCCGVDWQHEIGETSTVFYRTIKGLKASRSCWKQCGIIEVELKVKKWKYKQKLEGK